MSRKILCEACGSVLNEDILKQKNSLNTCLVCGASLGMDESESAPEEELVDWYYYLVGTKEHKVKSHVLAKKLIEDDEMFTLEYKFIAPKDTDKAKEVLRKEYDPTAFATLPVNTKPEPPIVRCPRCRSTSVQLVPRKFSILTGYRTNKVDRVCVNCKHRF